MAPGGQFHKQTLLLYFLEASGKKFSDMPMTVFCNAGFLTRAALTGILLCLL
jgi:hypothetical protein